MARKWIGTGLMSLAVVASPSAFAAGGGAAKKGPQGIPYHCSDGRSLRVVYGDQGPRATAELVFDGWEKLILQPTGGYAGKSYMVSRAPEPGLIWNTDGLSGVLVEAAADPSVDGRELARCDRLGWGGPHDTGISKDANPPHESSDAHH